MLVQVSVPVEAVVVLQPVERPVVEPVAAVVASALSVLAALVPVDVAVLPSTVSAVAILLVPSSALPVSLLVSASCACCSAVARGWVASAMAAMGIVAPTMDVHAVAQIR